MEKGIFQRSCGERECLSALGSALAHSEVLECGCPPGEQGLAIKGGVDSFP